MTVAEVSDRTGIPARTIRFWSRQGLVSPPRSPNGYRAYTDRDIEELGLVGRARGVGLSVDECRGLLDWAREEDYRPAVLSNTLRVAERAVREVREPGEQ